MKQIFMKIQNKKTKKSNHFSGFVLPYTLFVCMIMILLTTSISTVLSKQLYFSRLARQSKEAFYAADNAVLCTTIIDETYTDADGIGIFPASSTLSVQVTQETTEMDTVTLQYVKDHRAAVGLSSLATTLYGASDGIKCAQSIIFDPASDSKFKISPTVFSRNTTSGIEYGRTSSFNMKMQVSPTEYRCAKVTINKTPSYRQIIAQGYAICGKPSGSIERAIVSTTVTE